MAYKADASQLLKVCDCAVRILTTGRSKKNSDEKAYDTG
jgi:hypothetical protein